VSKVAATLRVIVDLWVSVPLKVLRDFTKRAIADAMDMSLDCVVKLGLSEVEHAQGTRRLGVFQRKTYDVPYEILPPSSFDIDAVMQAASRISKIGAPESQLFRQALTTQPEIKEVHLILEEVAAREFGDYIVEQLKVEKESTGDEERESSDTAVMVSIIAIASLLLLSAAGVMVYIHRAGCPKLSSIDPERDLDLEANCIPVMPQAPSHTLLDTPALGQQHKTTHVAWEFKEGRAPRTSLACNLNEEVAPNAMPFRMAMGLGGVEPSGCAPSGVTPCQHLSSPGLELEDL
jgi:hypothetical protein